MVRMVNVCETEQFSEKQTWTVDQIDRKGIFNPARKLSLYILPRSQRLVTGVSCRLFNIVYSRQLLFTNCLA